jgi:hypothetical protein
LREGRAGSNTTADHITVLDAALAQIPDAHRYGTEILIRSDSAGCTQGFLAHIRSLREHGVDTRFSVGVAITEPIREAIRATGAGLPPSTVTATCVTGRRSAKSPDCFPPTCWPTIPRARGSSCAANGRTPARN